MARTYPTLVTANSIADSNKFNDETVLQLQHLLGFTLDGVDLNTITSPLEIHNFKERVAPSTPSSGFVAMYADSADGVLKYKDDAGVITQVNQKRWTHDVPLSSGQFDIVLTDYEGFTGCKTLEIEVGLRSLVSATSDTIYIYFNADLFTTNYHRQTGGAQDGAELEAYNNFPQFCVCPGNTSPSGCFIEGVITIAGMDKSSVSRTARFNGGGRYESAKIRNEQSIVSWTGTDAITRIRIRPVLWSTNNFNTASWCRIHFIK